MQPMRIIIILSRKSGRIIHRKMSSVNNQALGSGKAIMHFKPSFYKWRGIGGGRAALMPGSVTWREKQKKSAPLMYNRKLIMTRNGK